MSEACLQATHASVLLSREMERAEWRCALPARSAAVGALVWLGTAMPCVASGNEKKVLLQILGLLGPVAGRRPAVQNPEAKPSGCQGQCGPATAKPSPAIDARFTHSSMMLTSALLRERAHALQAGLLTPTAQLTTKCLSVARMT